LKLGRELAAPARAGDLHRVLFFTFHRVFNLAYLDRMEENPALQHTIAFSWYQLGRLAADWGSCEAIAKDAVLPAAPAPVFVPPGRPAFPVPRPRRPAPHPVRAPRTTAPARRCRKVQGLRDS